MNKVFLMGHLGKDVELRALDGGKSVANVSLATTESYKDRDSGERKETTVWHNLVIWNRAAENLAKYAKKGSKLLVEGKIANRSYDKADGSKGYVSEVVVETFTFLDAAKTAATVATDATGEEAGSDGRY